jgi:hypothetical protein
MNRLKNLPGELLLCTTLLLGALAAGCSRDPVLGGGDVEFAPLVIASTPANAATGVALSTTAVTATFNQPIAPITGAASFTLTCAAPCVNPTGTVALNPAGRIATFTLAPATSLAPLTVYTATIAGVRNLAAGVSIVSPYTWTFTTAAIPDTTRPLVTSTAPLTSTPGPTGEPVNTAIVAAFTEGMAPATITSASFTVTCTAPCVSPTGTVSYVAASRTAVFVPTAVLAAATTYTATIAATVTDLAGNTLAGNQAVLPAASRYVWTFTTAAIADTTRPSVTLTVPATSTPAPTGVPANTAIVATFSEEMAPGTITAASFTLTCTAPCTSPAGTVSYAPGSRTAVFVPGASLAVTTTYTATIAATATDLAGNALAGNQGTLPAASRHAWTFTTAAAALPASVSVLSTSPSGNATGVCPNATVNATFSVPPGQRMDPGTINTATFTVSGPAPAVTPVTAASVTLNVATGLVATFAPQSAFIEGGTYTATIKGGATGVKDLAVPGNAMASDFTWTFLAGPATGACQPAPTLATAAPFGTFGGTSGMTNMGILTVINGDIGSIATGSSSMTGFHDTAGDIYTQTPANMGTVNGKIYSCTNSTTGPTSTGPNAVACAVATQARLDAQTAYLALAAMPSGANPGGNLAGLTLAPGVYTAPSGSFLIQGGNLTLDAQGNANAVWVFQMSTTLTVGGPGAAAPQSIILAGGAQARNVFWQVGSAATINAGGGGTMVGTIISQAGAAFSTSGNVAVVTLEGRALSLLASVTLVNTVVNVPGP